MSTTTKPTKQEIRDYMESRRTQKTPPPSPSETQKILDWHLKSERVSLYQDGKCSFI